MTRPKPHPPRPSTMSAPATRPSFSPRLWHRVTVEYDGSGDSGQIDDVSAWNAGDEIISFPSDRKITLLSENPDHPLAEQSFEAAVETLAWDYLEIYSGWENNDGAFGTFVFDVPARTVTLEHNERYTEVNTTSHEF